MKLVYKRSSAATALKEPAETCISEPAYQEPAPAPAGALHRVYPPGHTTVQEEDEEPYIPQRGSYGLRMRGGMPHSVAGRVLLGAGASTLLAAIALTAAGIRSFLLHDPRFLVNSSSAISVVGNNHIPHSEILGVFGSDLERNIFKISLAERQADLERLPWVAQATVMRLLPNHVRVQITERTPIAFTRQGTQIGLVDADGVLLDMPPESAGDPHYSFPVLTGLAADDSPETRASRMDVYRRFMAELGSAGPKVTQSLSEVDVTNPEDVKALVTIGGADIMVHFGDEDFLQRYQTFAQHLPEWRTQYPKLASADMRYERQVVLEMQPDAGATAAAAPSAAGASSSSPDLHNGTPHPAAKAPAGMGTPAPHGPADPVHSVPPARKPAVWRARAGSSAENQRVFAQLAAQRRAQQKRARWEKGQ